MPHDIFYTRNQHNKLMYWCIEWESNFYRTYHGHCPEEGIDGCIKDYVKSLSKWTCVNGVNKGKKNETTDSEQTQLVVYKKINDKIEAGYFKIGEECEKPFTPMLCQEWDKTKIKNFPVKLFFQPKLDGIRCCIIITESGVECVSRNNKLFPIVTKNVSNLHKELKNIIKLPIVLDGELYTSLLTFESLTSFVKGSEPLDERIKFNMFDCYIPDLFDLSFQDRWNFCNKIIANITTKFIKNVRTNFIEIFDKEELELVWNTQWNAFKDRYEGLIIRTNGPYEMTRSWNSFKYKEMKTEEFKVIDILEGKGNRLGTAGSAFIEISKNVYCSVGISGNSATTRDYLINKNKYIGEKATVQYQDKTHEGSLRFGVLIGFRNYE